MITKDYVRNMKIFQIQPCSPSNTEELVKLKQKVLHIQTVSFYIFLMCNFEFDFTFIFYIVFGVETIYLFIND